MSMAAPADDLLRLAPVVRYLEAHAAEPVTPRELAGVGCMSLRALHASFRRALGEPPMAYLRRVRLDRVRAELLGADPARVRVTDVAARWGFSHPSRFAQQYRAHFGELPSLTLRTAAEGLPRTDGRGEGR